MSRRPRTSTLGLTAVFLMTFVLYVAVRPEPEPDQQLTELVPAVRVPITTTSTARAPRAATTTVTTAPSAPTSTASTSQATSSTSSPTTVTWVEPGPAGTSPQVWTTTTPAGAP